MVIELLTHIIDFESQDLDEGNPFTAIDLLSKPAFVLSSIGAQHPSNPTMEGSLAHIVRELGIFDTRSSPAGHKK